MLPIPKGIDGIPAGQISDTWSSSWFMTFIRTWLRAADVRNATAGPGISITGQGIQPATISLTGITTGGPTVGVVVVPTAALTLAGTQGSLTFTNGILTAYTQAT